MPLLLTSSLSIDLRPETSFLSVTCLTRPLFLLCFKAVLSLAPSLVVTSATSPEVSASTPLPLNASLLALPSHCHLSFLSPSSEQPVVLHLLYHPFFFSRLRYHTPSSSFHSRVTSLNHVIAFCLAILFPHPPSAHLLCLLSRHPHPFHCHHLRPSSTLYQLLAPALALMSLRFFHFQDVKHYGRRLVEYPAMSPSSTSYQLLAPAVIFLLAVVCFLPVVLLAFLFRQHRRGVLRELRASQCSGSVGVSSAAAVSVRGSSGSVGAALLLQLCCLFRAEYSWWMPPFIAIRRLLVVAVFVASPEPGRWVWLTLLQQLLLALHLQVQPYERSQDNLLESLSLFCLCVQTTLLCLLSVAAHSGAFASLVLCPLLTMAALRLRPAWQKMKALRQERRAKREAGRRQVHPRGASHPP